MYFKQLASISCTLISMKIGQFCNPLKYIRCVTKYISKAVTRREARVGLGVGYKALPILIQLIVNLSHGICERVMVGLDSVSSRQM